MWILVNRLEAPRFIDSSERLYLGGRHCHHTFLEWGKEEGWLNDGTPVIIINLRDEKNMPLTKTWACNCWRSMLNVCQVSVRGVGDAAGDYLVGVLDEVVTLEIDAGLTRDAVLLIHCNSGIHRAPTTGLSFLLKRTTKAALTYAGAFDLVVQSRPVVFAGDRKGESPTNNFQNQVESLYRMEDTVGAITQNSHNMRSAFGDGRQRELAKPPVKDVDSRWVPFVVFEPPVAGAAKRLAAKAATTATTAMTTATATTPATAPTRSGRKRKTTAATTATVVELDCGRDCSFKCNRTAVTHNKRMRWCFKQLTDVFQVSLLTIEAALGHEREAVLDALYSAVAHDGVGHFALLMAAVSSAVKLEKRSRFSQFATKSAASHTCAGLASFIQYFRVNASTCEWLFPASPPQLTDPLARLLSRD